MNPSGEEITLENEPEVTNWNYADSDIRITSKRIPNPTVSVSFNLSYYSKTRNDDFYRLLGDGVTLWRMTERDATRVKLNRKSNYRSVRPLEVQRLFLYLKPCRGYLLRPGPNMSISLNIRRLSKQGLTLLRGD